MNSGWQRLLVAVVAPSAAVGCGPSTPDPGAGAVFTTAHFTGAGNCTSCHDGLTDGAGQDVSIGADWGATMMASSSRDPFWRAKVASELRRAPALAAVINDTCSRCHAPMANVEAKAAGHAPEILGAGFVDAQNPLHAAAMDGVSCTLCHQIEPRAELGTLAAFSGGYTVGSPGRGVDRPLFGPFAGPRTGPMRNAVGYTPTHGPHIAQSETCATCHNLKTPFVDAGGRVASTTPESEFPEQMVYTEWQNSRFAGEGGTSCQGCHLPRTNGVVVATRPKGLPRRDAFGRHTLVGGNTMMLDLLDRNRDELGITAGGFERTIARTRESLASAAKVTIVSPVREGAQLRFVVQIDNLSGHKLPTSYPSRRVWLHVLASDAAGLPVFESGKMLDDGRIVGVDADSSAGAFERHHDVIAREDDVQVYETIMGNTDGAMTYTLLRGATYLKDNRLLPAGFPKDSAPPDVAVRGAALEDPSFVGGGDAVTFRLPSATGVTAVLVELRYQAIAAGFVDDLFTDEAEPTVATFARLWRGATLRAETIASASVVVP
jgi:hypothetical protein